MQSRFLATSLAAFDRDPILLARQRAQRFGDGPPPYTSGNTTAMPSPEPATRPQLDKTQRYWKYHAEYSASFPSEQFQAPATRLRDRLFHQDLRAIVGRKATFSIDHRLDLRAEAENHIRAHWIRQSIWYPSWGPAWAPWTDLVTSKNPLGDGPYHIGKQWTTRRGSAKVTWESTEAANEPGHNVSGMTAPKSKGKQAVTIDNSASLDDENNQVDPKASEPLQQFLYQLHDEWHWLRDELEFNHEKPEPDLDTLAFQSLRKAWTDQGIWMSDWKVMPGPKWLHETLSFDEYQSRRDREDGLNVPSASGARTQRAQSKLPDHSLSASLHDEADHRQPRVGLFGMHSNESPINASQSCSSNTAGEPGLSHAAAGEDGRDVSPPGTRLFGNSSSLLRPAWRNEQRKETDAPKATEDPRDGTNVSRKSTQNEAEENARPSAGFESSQIGEIFGSAAKNSRDRDQLPVSSLGQTARNGLFLPSDFNDAQSEDIFIPALNVTAGGALLGQDVDNAGEETIAFGAVPDEREEEAKTQHAATLHVNGNDVTLPDAPNPPAASEHHDDRSSYPAEGQRTPPINETLPDAPGPEATRDTKAVTESEAAQEPDVSTIQVAHRAIGRSKKDGKRTNLSSVHRRRSNRVTGQGPSAQGKDNHASTTTRPEVKPQGITKTVQKKRGRPRKP